MAKRLYIETVGCQMNMLDSELVVASLRKAGLRAGRQPGQGRHDPVQHLQRPAACRRQDLQRPGPAEARQEAQPAQDHRRAGLHGPERPAADLRAGAVRRPGRRPGPDCTRFRKLLERDRRRRRAADGSQPRPHGRQPRRGRARASRATIRCAIEQMRPIALPGVRADHDRLRQVLHLLHRAAGARARAKPAGRPTSWPKPASWPPKAAARSRCWARPSTATSTRPTAAPRGCPTCSVSCTTSTGIDRIKFVTNYPKDMTDDLLQAVRDLPKCLALSARAGAKRLERGAAADEARLHGRRISRDAGPHSRDGARRGGDQRFHRRLLRRDGRRFRGQRSSWCAKAASRTASSSSTARGPAPRATSCIADDVPEEVKRRRNNELLAMQNAISEEDNQAVSGPRGAKCWSKGRARSARKQDDDGRRACN